MIFGNYICHIKVVK